MIKRISYSILTHNELSALSTQIIKVMEKAEKINSVTLNNILIKLIRSAGEFLKILNRNKKNKHSKIIKQRDKNRDDAFRALRDSITGASRRLNETYRQNAKMLLEIIKLHGNTLYRENKQVESAKLNSLIKDYDTPDAQDALASIQLTEYYTELKQSQRDFETAFYNKANDKSKVESTVIAKKRNELIKCIKALLTRIESDSEFGENSENYTDTINTLNNILSETFTLAKSRRKRKDNNDNIEDTD